MKNEISRREEDDDDDDKRFQTNKGKCFPVSNFCSCEVGTLNSKENISKKLHLTFLLNLSGPHLLIIS